MQFIKNLFRNEKLEAARKQLQHMHGQNRLLLQKNTELELNVANMVANLSQVQHEKRNLENVLQRKNEEAAGMRTRIEELSSKKESERSPRGQKNSHAENELKKLRRRTDVLVSMEPLLKRFAKAFSKCSFENDQEVTEKMAAPTTELGKALINKKFHLN